MAEETQLDSAKMLTVSRQIASTGCLNISQLPFKRHRENPVDHRVVTKAFSLILPEVGKLLKSISYYSGIDFNPDFVEISNEQLEMIAEFCPHLVSLHLTDVKMPRGLKRLEIGKLSRLTRLRSFSLVNTTGSFLPDAAAFADRMAQFNADLSQLIRIWPLQSLVLSGWEYEETRLWPDIPALTTNLTRLHLVNISVNDIRLAQVCQNCPLINDFLLKDSVGSAVSVEDFSPLGQLKLNRLSLTYCGELDELLFDQMSHNWPNLTHLTAIGCYSHDEPLLWLQNCPALEYLRTNSDGLNVASLHSCQKLQTVDICHMGDKFTNAQVVQLAHLPRLQQLNVGGRGIMRCGEVDVRWDQLIKSRQTTGVVTPLLVGLHTDNWTEVGVQMRQELAKVNIAVLKVFTPVH